MYVLGLWDGHDAGACIIKDNKISVAINEERLSRKKLDVCFPSLSIKACLDYLKLKPTDINIAAASTTDFAKTLTRVSPIVKEKYYLFRRRKAQMPILKDLRRNFKYKVTEIKPNALTRSLTRRNINKNLEKLGFKDFTLYIIDHHLAHAASTAYTSNFKKALTITIDGIGDALSGTINVFDNGRLERISSLSSKDSLGIFYEQVTDVLGMRCLEDEGKVMALSNYSYKINDENNKMIDFFQVNGLNIKSKYSVSKRYFLLKKILWNTPLEQFAHMAQRVLEKNVYEITKNAIDQTGIKNICYSGGVASNIKANMIISQLADKWHIFPHMGDGGLAVGAALHINSMLNNIQNYKFDDVYLGLDYGDDEIKADLQANNLKFDYREDISKYVADLINKNKFVLWFQGRMEYGPRALGNRSILASASSIKTKDDLNVSFKRRNWFQPFCPSLLKEDAEKIFQDVKQHDKFMVMGYKIKEDKIKDVKAVINVDNTARPQMLGNENDKFRTLLEEVKKKTGLGIVLNTSFNLHGYPIVNSPKDAVEVLKNTNSQYLAIGNYIVEK